MQLKIFSVLKVESQKAKEIIARFKARQNLDKIRLAFKVLAQPKMLKNKLFLKMSDAAAFWINIWLEQFRISQKVGTKMDLGDKINSKSFSSFSPLERGEVFIKIKSFFRIIKLMGKLSLIIFTINDIKNQILINII